MLRVLILRQQLSRPLLSTVSAQKPLTTSRGAKFAASDEDSEPRKKKRTKANDDHSKKRKKRSTKMYCSLHGGNTSHTPRECNVLKSKGKEKTKLSKKDFKNKAREFNIIEKKASQDKAKYLKYKILNKASSKNKTPVILGTLKATPQAARKKIPLVRKNIP